MLYSMKLSIHFRLRLEKSNPKNEKQITIRCHVNIDGQKEKRFSTGRSIKQARWSQDSERVINDGSWEAQSINNDLNSIYNKLFKLFDNLKQLHSYVDSTLLVDEYETTLIPPKNIIEYYDEYLEELESKIGQTKNKGGLELTTFKKWKNARNHLDNFIKHELKKEILYINHITTPITDSFLKYMENQKNKHGEPIQEIHAYRVMMNLNTILTSAVKDKYIKTNTIAFSKIERPKTEDKEIIYLTYDELMMIYNCDMLTKLERGVVDCFIFLSFTGFTYSDYMEFIVNPNNFIFNVNDNYYIKKRRYKDRKKANPTVPMIPFMQIHKTILERNKYEMPSFPIETINKQIKIIAQRLKLPNAAKITSYVGRKSAGTFFLNQDGIEQKTVSKIMGHKDDKMLMKHYAVILDTTIERQTSHLSIKV
jgi:integrase/recombinase XerD